MAFQGLMIIALLLKLEAVRQLVERGASIPIGSPAPDFAGTDQFDEQTGLSKFDGRGGIVLFVAPDCSLCKNLLASIDSSAAKVLPHWIVVCRGDKYPCGGVAERLGRSVSLIIDQSGSVAAAYGAASFPRAVIVDGQKKVRGYSHPRTVDDLRRAFDESLSEPETRMAAEDLSLTSSNPT